MSPTSNQFQRLFAALIVVASLLLFAACGNGDDGPDINNISGNDVCRADSESELCEQHDFECGTHTVVDSCDDERTIDCGDGETVCDDPHTCGGGGQEGVCGCSAETDDQLCDDYGVECGPLDEAVDETVVDACDQEREAVFCGDEEEVCGEGETCGGGDQEAGVCGCTPETDDQLCDSYGVECGYIDDVVDDPIVDRCGDEHQDVFCGDEENVCDQFETCGGGGQEGVCGCEAESDDELCDAEGYECGPLEGVTDSCGEERYVDSCGQESDVCGDNETCGGGEEPGVCGCTPTSCEEEGVLCGTIDDECGGTLDCDLFCADEVAVGDQHACAVGSESVKCWGRNNQGQLGVGDTSNRQNPESVIIDPDDDDNVLQQVDSITAGTNHSCALLLDGTVQCWGLNDYGQLGDGVTNDSTVPSTPTAEGTIAVDAGANHTCAIVEVEEPYEDDSGNTETQDVERIKCWGHNSHGQIGNPLLEIGAVVAEPEQINHLDGELEDYIALDVEVGDYHSCGLFRGPFQHEPFDEANEDDLEDVVRCWGDNRFGQIKPDDLARNYHQHHDDGLYAYGINIDFTDLPIVDTPTVVEARLTDVAGDYHVTAGADHTCVHDDETEETRCQGPFTYDSADGPDCDGALDIYDGEDDDEGHQYDTVGTEPDHCAILPDEELYPTQFPEVYPLFGYTGDDDHSLEETYLDKGFDDPYTFEIADSDDIDDLYEDQLETIQVESGANHYCGIVEDFPALSSSNIYCMGNNRWGQLGDGTDNNWPLFNEVSPDVDGNYVEATQISMGRDLTCALLENSNIKCWGSNAHGQIGNSELDEDESLQPYNVQLSIADD